jgi:hypothetical protein
MFRAFPARHSVRAPHLTSKHFQNLKHVHFTVQSLLFFPQFLLKKYLTLNSSGMLPCLVSQTVTDLPENLEVGSWTRTLSENTPTTTATASPGVKHLQPLHTTDRDYTSSQHHRLQPEDQDLLILSNHIHTLQTGMTNSNQLLPPDDPRVHPFKGTRSSRLA